MTKTLKINNKDKIDASLVFFIITTCQVGVGVHGFQRLITQEAKQDAWIAVILSFLFSHIVVFVMIKTLELYETQDLYEIHNHVFGKYLGNVFNSIFILYFTFAFFVVMRNYAEVINTWVFPNLSEGFISISLFVLIIYGFTGGFRVLVGIAFFSFIATLWIPIILIYPLEYANYNHLLPILVNDLASILKGAYSMTFSIVGFEILYFIYPFVKNPKKVQKYAHFGLLATLFLYLSIMLVSIVYFSAEQLEKTIWATLILFSVIKLPFIERIEIITIAIWIIILLPNLCFFLWGAYRGVSRIFKNKPRVFLSIFCIVVYIFIMFTKSRYQIDQINNYYAQIAFFMVFIYPFLLYIFALTKKSITKRVRNR